MAKSKKPSKTVLEYRRVRKNLLQNIRRLEDRGYDVSKINVPDIPEKITRRDINALKKLDKNRYKQATYEVEVVKNKGRKNERIEVTKVSGEKYRKQERKISAEKAAATRRVQREEKKKEDYKNLQFDKLSTGDITYDDYVELTGETIDSYERAKIENITRKYSTESDRPDFGTWFNPETGEIKEGRKPRYGNWLMGQEAIDAYQKSVYETALKRVENMQIYEGKDKRARQIKSNADRIRQKIEEEYEKNPKAVTKVISEMASTGALEDVEVWYFAKGYDKFEYNFMMYLGLLDEVGMYDDETEFTDYDE